jgi:ATP-binding cassette, subfamily B, bacterial
MSKSVRFSSLRRWWRVLGFLEGQQWAVGVILCLALGCAGLSALEPLLLKRVVDGLSGGLGAAVAWGILLLLGMTVVREGLTALQNWLTWRTRLHVQYKLQEASVGRLHCLPVSFHRQEGVGALMTRLDRGIQGLVSAVGEMAFNVIPALVYLLVAVVIMVQLNWRLALGVLVFAPFPALIATVAAPAQTARERRLMERWVSIYSRFNEVLSGIVTVKSFAMEHREKQRFLTQVCEANGVVVRGVGLDALVGLSQGAMVLMARGVALGVGAWLVTRGEMTVGTLVAFLGYVGGLFGPVQGLSGTYKALRTASVSLEQVFSILDAQDSLGDAPDAREVTHVQGAVTFRGIRFRWPGQERYLLNGIDLHVRPGESIALVGPSGAGKTTLMSLLCRLYDPEEGQVLVDGRDLRTLKQASLRRNIGVVLQDSLLFNESVRNNIAYGRPGASMEEIVAAARAAHAHEFIVQLPEGYDTVVGERGSRLSAGERQRIAIARSLLKDPPILVLDEPTSALDAESEALVQEALLRLMKGRTTFSIAHRLSTVVGADRILVLKDGQLIEEGSHTELMRQGGYYASLVRRQTQGLLIELPSTSAA